MVLIIVYKPQIILRFQPTLRPDAEEHNPLFAGSLRSNNETIIVGITVPLEHLFHRTPPTEHHFFTRFVDVRRCSSKWPATLLKRDSSTGVFLWIFQIPFFLRIPFFNRTPPVVASGV